MSPDLVKDCQTSVCLQELELKRASAQVAASEHLAASKVCDHCMAEPSSRTKPKASYHARPQADIGVID